MYVDRTVHILVLQYIELHVQRTVQAFWYADLYMEPSIYDLECMDVVNIWTIRSICCLEYG